MSRQVSRILLLAALLLAGTSHALWAAPITVERIVAKINDDIITLSELQDFVKEEVEKLRQRYKGDEFERRRREFELKGLDALVENKLILQRAKVLNLSVSEKELEQAIASVLRRNRLTSEGLRRYLRTQGTSLETYRERIRERILIQKVVNLEVNVRVAVSEEEVAAFHETNLDQFRKGEARRVHQIFFPIPKDATDEKKEEQRRKAEAAYQEVSRNGADFAELAKKLSEGPAASRGGDLGFIKKGEVFPELENLVFSLEKGLVSKPVRTRVGYHVVRVAEIRPGEVITLDRVAGEIRDRLFTEKRAKRRRDWVAELKRAAFLEVSYDPSATAEKGTLDSLFREVREQVTFRLTRIELLESAELLGRERVFWAYGSNRRDPRWTSEKLKVDDRRRLEPDELASLEKMHRDFINPDPAANIYIFEHNYLFPNIYLGKVSFADVIKEFSLEPKKKSLQLTTDTKKARVEFQVSVEKTRSIVADPKEIGK